MLIGASPFESISGILANHHTRNNGFNASIFQNNLNTFIMILQRCSVILADYTGMCSFPWRLYIHVQFSLKTLHTCAVFLEDFTYTSKFNNAWLEVGTMRRFICCSGNTWKFESKFTPCTSTLTLNWLY